VGTGEAIFHRLFFRIDRSFIGGTIYSYHIDIVPYLFFGKCNIKPHIDIVPYLYFGKCNIKPSQSS
jgi:hypothetical protein